MVLALFKPSSAHIDTPVSTTIGKAPDPDQVGLLYGIRNVAAFASHVGNSLPGELSCWAFRRPKSCGQQ